MVFYPLSVQDQQEPFCSHQSISRGHISVRVETPVLGTTQRWLMWLTLDGTRGSPHRWGNNYSIGGHCLSLSQETAPPPPHIWGRSRRTWRGCKHLPNPPCRVPTKESFITQSDDMQPLTSLSTSLSNEYYHSPHFTEEDTEAQRGKVTLPKVTQLVGIRA